MHWSSIFVALTHRYDHVDTLVIHSAVVSLFSYEIPSWWPAHSVDPQCRSKHFEGDDLFTLTVTAMSLHDIILHRIHFIKCHHTSKGFLIVSIIFIMWIPIARKMFFLLQCVPRFCHMAGWEHSPWAVSSVMNGPPTASWWPGQPWICKQTALHLGTVSIYVTRPFQEGHLAWQILYHTVANFYFHVMKTSNPVDDTGC